MFIHDEQGLQRPSYIPIASGNGIFDSRIVAI